MKICNLCLKELASIFARQEAGKLFQGPRNYVNVNTSLSNYRYGWTASRPFSSSAVRGSGVPGLGTGKGARISVDLEHSAESYMEEKKLKPKEHPGALHTSRAVLPLKFITTAQRLLSYENPRQMYDKAVELKNHLGSRQLPIEDPDYKSKVEKIEEKIRMKDDVLRPFLSEEQLERLDAARDGKIRKILKKSVYHWEPIQYDKQTALQYMLVRSAGEYAALVKILSEIQKRDPEFRPETLYDFGSGVGTSAWASKIVWPKCLKEVMCIDMSKDMNELAERLLRGGSLNNDHEFGALFFRQFLGQSSRVHYDVVISAYSLMELPSLKKRLKTIDILWKKANRYLVIVEQGTPAGFKAVIEARDYVLQLDKFNRGFHGHNEELPHVFSPCPHDNPCPRFMDSESACNFTVKYKNLYPFHHDSTSREKFSYVVLKKGSRAETDEQWPRLIEDPLIRKKHCVCRVCTKWGTLNEVVLTRSKHSQLLYRIGRKSKVGDRLPVKELQDRNVSADYEGTNEVSDSDEDADHEEGSPNTKNHE